MEDSDTVAVTEEKILHDTASPVMEDSDTVAELLEHSNTCHRQTLPFPWTPADEDEDDRVYVPDYAKIGILKKQC